jgi:hypothetical protein
MALGVPYCSAESLSPALSGDVMAAYGSSLDYTRSYDEAEGAVKSTCRHCSRTVAVARDEKKLSLLEEIHLCIPKLAAANQLVVGEVLRVAGNRCHVL